MFSVRARGALTIGAVHATDLCIWRFIVQIAKSVAPGPDIGMFRGSWLFVRSRSYGEEIKVAVEDYRVSSSWIVKLVAVLDFFLTVLHSKRTMVGPQRGFSSFAEWVLASHRSWCSDGADSLRSLTCEGVEGQGLGWWVIGDALLLAGW